MWHFIRPFWTISGSNSLWTFRFTVAKWSERLTKCPYTGVSPYIRCNKDKDKDITPGRSGWLGAAAVGWISALVAVLRSRAHRHRFRLKIHLREGRERAPATRTGSNDHRKDKKKKQIHAAGAKHKMALRPLLYCQDFQVAGTCRCYQL